jgi:hypothetical protein
LASRSSSNSFTGEEMQEGGRYAARDAYAMAMAVKDNFVTTQDLLRRQQVTADDQQKLAAGEIIVHRTMLDVDGLQKYESQALQTRPQGAQLSRRLAAYGHYNLYFLLDFGSYRDVQRHRNGVCQVPLIDGTFGIFPWYYQQLATLLPEGFEAFKGEVDRLLAAIEALPLQGVATDKLRNQYLYPMGMALLCHLGYSVPQLTYVAELRSQATVHASLRPVAQAFGRVLREDFPHMALYIDDSADTWSAKRGEQTIEAKAA